MMHVKKAPSQPTSRQKADEKMTREIQIHTVDSHLAGAPTTKSHNLGMIGAIIFMQCALGVLLIQFYDIHILNFRLRPELNCIFTNYCSTQLPHMRSRLFTFPVHSLQ